MPKAHVTLKEGLTYTYKDYVFRPGVPTPVVVAEDIEHCKSIGVLNVAVEEDAPIPAKPLPGKPKPLAGKSAPADDTDDGESEDADDDGETEDGDTTGEKQPVGKPGTKPPANKPGVKPASK